MAVSHTNKAVYYLGVIKEHFYATLSLLDEIFKLLHPELLTSEIFPSIFFFFCEKVIMRSNLRGFSGSPFLFFNVTVLCIAVNAG